MEDLAKQIQEGSQSLGLNLTQTQITQLFEYTKLLAKWNKTYSLTAITAMPEMVTYHILDGLTIIPYLNNFATILDVGSGMGVPGIIIAICNPDKKVVVLDSNSKKTGFLNQVKIELKLSNLTVVHSRVEAYSPKFAFCAVVSRALTTMDVFIKWCNHLVKPGGVIMAMKAKGVEDEITLIEKEFSYELIPLSIPDVTYSKYLDSGHDNVQDSKTKSIRRFLLKIKV